MITAKSLALDDAKQVAEAGIARAKEMEAPSVAQWSCGPDVGGFTDDPPDGLSIGRDVNDRSDVAILTTGMAHWLKS